MTKNKLPPHLLEKVRFRVGKFDSLDKSVPITCTEFGGDIAWVDNDDVPNIGVSKKGFGFDVATLMAAAPELRDMVKQLLADNPGSALAGEANLLLKGLEFTVVLPEDYEDDDS